MADVPLPGPTVGDPRELAGGDDGDVGGPSGETARVYRLLRDPGTLVDSEGCGVVSTI